MKKYQTLLMEVITYNAQDVLTNSPESILNGFDVTFNASDFFTAN